MILTKFGAGKLFAYLEKRPWIFFIFLFLLIIIVFHSLLDSYFESDEWFHFTYYLPLTGKPEGFLTAFISTIVDTGGILTGAGQHVTPIATEIFFLNTKFFGINFFPYAFISLLLHTVNSFLVFLFIKTLLHKKSNSNVFAILGGIFFAFTQTSIQAVTWAAFYSENILSVTFFLLCTILFRKAFIEKSKKFIYLSIIFLFLAFFSKETTFFLFLLLPFMAIIEKRIFSLNFLGKIFALCIIIYILIRFIVPNISTFKDRLTDKLMGGKISSSAIQKVRVVDTGTIVSRDLSIYANLPKEVVLRTVTFPLRMMSTLFLPRTTASSIVQFITPIVIPQIALGDFTFQPAFFGPANFMIIYLLSLVIIIFCLSSVASFVRKRKLQEARTLATGLAIVIFSSFPLVAIIFSFPRWGYDFYFDGRHYYNPAVGAAIVFPFLLFGLGRIISKSLRTKKISIVVLSIFIIWLINNMYVFSLNLNQTVDRSGSDRREVVSQLKNYLPALPKKTVFYFETDGKSAFGPVLPFYTSVPQALTVVYYDKSPLPNSFFAKPLFNGMPQGYSYSEGRGLGYYTSKKDLSQALIDKKFELSDIHAFYYKSLEGKLLDNTLQVRKEMQYYINGTDIRDWREFNDSSLGIKFLYPQLTGVEEMKSPDTNIVKLLSLKDTRFNAEVSFINVPPTFDIHGSIQFINRKDGTSLTFQDIIERSTYFDKYRFNKLIATNEDNPRYFLRSGNILVYVKTANSNAEGLKIIERILGSLEITNEK